MVLLSPVVSGLHRTVVRLPPPAASPLRDQVRWALSTLSLAANRAHQETWCCLQKLCVIAAEDKKHSKAVIIPMLMVVIFPIITYQYDHKGTSLSGG
jgi:hypothetical protein